MDLAFWRDVALVVLVVEGMIFGLVPLVLLFLAIRGVRWVEQRARRYGPEARERWHRVHRYVDRTMSTARAPFQHVDELITLAQTLVGHGEET